MIFDTLIDQVKFSGQISIDRGLARRLSGGMFSVKVAGVKRNANQSLSLTPMEPDIPTVIPTTKGRN